MSNEKGKKKINFHPSRLTAKESKINKGAPPPFEQ